MRNTIRGLVVLSLALAAGFARGEEAVVLKASKDTFGRSNERNRNSGASPTLLVARDSSVCSIIAFDLSGITNQIEGATFRFRQHNTMEDAISLIVAPMVQTPRNAAWLEGTGSLGTKGQNARPGESCYGWSAFPDAQWEAGSGVATKSLGDPQLWKPPVATLNLQWKEGEWVEVAIKDFQMLETLRKSDSPIVTFGLWGTSGNGLYGVSSKESGNAPQLVLVLKAEEGATK